MKRTLVAAALVLAACAHDLPGWKVASTEHIRLYTDQGRHSYEAVLERLEDVYAALHSSLFSATDIPPTEVFLFNPGEFHDLLGPVGGMAIPGVGREGILAVFEGWDPVFLDRTAAHELAHRFIGAAYGGVPVWFNEGLATYLESVAWRGDAVLLGSHHVHVEDDALNGRFVKVANLFALPYTQFHGDWEARHYVTGWALVHYIWHGEDKRLRRRFGAFVEALAAEGRAPRGSERAWDTAFPDVPVATLDERLAHHMNEALFRGRDMMVGFKFVRPERPPLQLAPADMRYVDQVRAQLRRFRRADKL